MQLVRRGNFHLIQRDHLVEQLDYQLRYLIHVRQWFAHNQLCLVPRPLLVERNEVNRHPAHGYRLRSERQQSLIL